LSEVNLDYKEDILQEKERIFNRKIIDSKSNKIEKQSKTIIITYPIQASNTASSNELASRPRHSDYHLIMVMKKNRNGKRVLKNSLKKRNHTNSNNHISLISQTPAALGNLNNL